MNVARSGDERRVLSVRQLNESIQTALQNAFPQPVWIRGEVQRFPVDAARRKHVYFELHDTSGGGAADFQMPAALLGWDRDRHALGRYLDGSDATFQLRDKLEVCLLCRVDFYPPFGKVSLRVVGVDPAFTLGQLEARRRQVLAALEAAGLLERNRALLLPEVPLRVGLITSAGSAAERDFRTGLERSAYRFVVDLVDCRMQGEQMETQIVQALAVLARRDLDVIVITRGGGSRADLSWFDQQALCEAVARCRRPVVVGIGHEIDRSLTDLVAHTSCKTPTAAAEFLVDRVRDADARLTAAAAAVAALSERRLGDAGMHLRGLAGTLEGRVLRRVQGARRRVDGAGAATSQAARQRLAAARQRSRYLAEGLARESARTLPRRRERLERLVHDLQRLGRERCRQAGQRLGHADEKLRLLDPRRLLARGFTWTLDAAGRHLRSAAGLGAGDRLRTVFADGEVTSTVNSATAATTARPRGKGARRGGEEDPGQQALF